MRKLLFLMMMFPLFAVSQYSDQSKLPGQTTSKPTSKPAKKPTKARSGFGIKAGVNFANVTNASSINGSNKTGFMFGAFMGSARGLISRRMELIYSKQGYDYKTNSKTGTVDMDYILLPMLMGIHVGKFALIEVGTQTAFLLNAKADSTSSQPGTDPNSNPYGSSSMMQYAKRLNQGAAAGIEIYPYKGILIGARYNVSFGDMYKDYTSTTTPAPSFLPKINAKSNVVQIFIGYRF